MTLRTLSVARQLLKMMPDLNLLEKTIENRLFIGPEGSRMLKSIFAKQEKCYYSTLPRLPLPPLKQTLQRFLAVSKALLNESDYKETVQIVEEFGKPSGEGEKLHNLLDKKAQTLDNWLSTWWLHSAYLEQRCPLPINVSPGLTFPKQNYHGISGQVEFVSNLIVALLRYKSLIDGGELQLDTASKMPLDMSQYDLLFGTTRIPCQSRDTLRYGVNETSPVHHCIVAYKNTFYKLFVYDVNGTPLSCMQISDGLNKIIAHHNRQNAIIESVGLLTTENRDIWAKARDKLLRSEKNAQNFDDIESGLFLICIDQPFGVEPTSDADSAFGSQLLHGGGSECNAGNRWYDKLLQFVVAPDGHCGLTYEHSPAEGPPIAALMDFVMDFMPKCKSVPSAKENVSNFSMLKFDLDAEDRSVIKRAAKNFDKLASDVEMRVMRFKHFGKQFAKSQRVSPDSVVQLALQLTFYKIHKECPATYETGTLRRFHLGRTDTIRLPTVDSLNFVRLSVDSHTSDVQKAESFKKAVQSHKEYTAAACSGNGIDRHLLGLKLIALENGYKIPDFFESKAYHTAIHFKLSTSQVSAKQDSCMMFGPMYPDCYGVCYNPQIDQINISVSAFNSYPGTSAAKFANVLESSLLEIRDFLMKGTKSKL